MKYNKLFVTQTIFRKRRGYIDVITSRKRGATSLNDKRFFLNYRESLSYGNALIKTIRCCSNVIETMLDHVVAHLHENRPLPHSIL